MAFNFKVAFWIVLVLLIIVAALPSDVVETSECSCPVTIAEYNEAVQLAADWEALYYEAYELAEEASQGWQDTIDIANECIALLE